MKKDRQPTPEERRLWREVTRGDVKFVAPPADEDSAALPPEPPPPATYSPAPPPPARKTTPPPLASLEGRKANRLLKPYAPIEATLDLHGMGKVQAYGEVMEFLDRAQRAGMRHVLIITGKGRDGEGILRASLPQWLNEPALRPRIVGIAHPHPGKGGTGVLHVVLKRQRT